MKFSTETRIAPDVYKDDIPVIHGTNFYINEEQYVATFNKAQYTVFDQNGNSIVVQSIKPVTEFIYIINQKIAYRTSTGFLVTNINAKKEKQEHNQKINKKRLTMQKLSDIITSTTISR